METVKMILENWVYFFILLILGLLTVYAILRFMKLTPKQQLEKVKVALLYMVTEAEKELKSKTGRIKRSMVYGMGMAGRKIPDCYAFYHGRTVRQIIRPGVRRL